MDRHKNIATFFYWCLLNYLRIIIIIIIIIVIRR